LRRKFVPFVFATGYDKESLPPSLEGVSVLSKPFSTSALRDALAAMLKPEDLSSTVVSLRPRGLK
jgi:hypothetical protein